MGALIWLASYPKSGNTWLRSFLHNLLRDAPEPVELNKLDEFCVGEARRIWVERRAGRPIEKLSPPELAKLRLLAQADMTKVFRDSVFVKTHNYLGPWHNVPLHNMSVTAGAIYILRNPLDVVLSARHHFNMTIDDTITLMVKEKAGSPLSKHLLPEVYSSWSSHVRSWTAQPNPQLLVVRYEDLLDDPQKYFGTVASFLGLRPTEERLTRAIRNSSFKILKAQEEQKGFRERPAHAEAFFRTGKADQWREELTPAQIRRIIANHREQMTRFGYIPEDYA